jgi:hypothetical protein
MVGKSKVIGVQTRVGISFFAIVWSAMVEEEVDE